MDLTVLLEGLKNKTEAELTSLHAEALTIEANAKKEVVILTQKVSNLGGNLGTEEGALLEDAKKYLDYIQAYLTEVENALAKVTPTETSSI
jgi:hypothetical protein